MEQAHFLNKSWRNPYIDLNSTLPEHLISAGPAGLSEEQQALIINKIAGATETYIELGCGSGAHLHARAQKSAALFIGFELRFKRAFKAAAKAKKFNLDNLLIIRSDAKAGLNLFKPDSLAGCYVNFPDPWIKERWQKHLLLNTETIKLLAKILRPGGFLSYKTDHTEAFRATQQLIATSNLLSVTAATEDLYNSSLLTESVSTEFEMLFRSKSQPINLLIAKRNN